MALRPVRFEIAREFPVRDDRPLSTVSAARRSWFSTAPTHAAEVRAVPAGPLVTMNSHFNAAATPFGDIGICGTPVFAVAVLAPGFCYLCHSAPPQCPKAHTVKECSHSRFPYLAA
jgi:hypothetical protein